MTNITSSSNFEKQVHLLLADDDADDRFFFDKVLKQLKISTKLTTVKDGEELMIFLSKNYNQLPDVLFLDLNMPRKNGAECLIEIKQNKKLKNLPVVIYSTSLLDKTTDLLYENGAYYYIRKTDILELKRILEHLLPLIAENKLTRTTRDKFVLSVMTE